MNVVWKGFGENDSPPPQDEVELCERFIAKFGRKIKAISTKRSSYGLKHVVETWSQIDPENPGKRRERIYVSNGAFIQAALNLGFEARRCHETSLNAHFNMGFEKWFFSRLDEIVRHDGCERFGKQRRRGLRTDLNHRFYP